MVSSEENVERCVPMIGKYLSVFLVSMVPLVGLRLGVRIAIGVGLDYSPSLIV